MGSDGPAPVLALPKSHFLHGPSPMRRLKLWSWDYVMTLIMEYLSLVRFMTWTSPLQYDQVPIEAVDTLVSIIFYDIPLVGLGFFGTSAAYLDYVFYLFLLSFTRSALSSLSFWYVLALVLLIGGFTDDVLLDFGPSERSRRVPIPDKSPFSSSDHSGTFLCLYS
jgi:hypothetical protein